jgi:hypothetical protein
VRRAPPFSSSGAGDCDVRVTAALRVLRCASAPASCYLQKCGGDHNCDGVYIHVFKIFRLNPSNTPADTRAV